MSDTSLHATHHHALYAHDALGRGPIYSIIHERGGCVTEELDWARCSASHRAWIPSVEREARLLIGLAAAAGLGLVHMRLTPVNGDTSAYVVCWRRRGALT